MFPILYNPTFYISLNRSSIYKGFFFFKKEKYLIALWNRTVALIWSIRELEFSVVIKSHIAKEYLMTWGYTQYVGES